MTVGVFGPRFFAMNLGGKYEMFEESHLFLRQDGCIYGIPSHADDTWVWLVFFPIFS